MKKQEQQPKSPETPAKKEVPFFARYLQGHGMKVKAGIKAGASLKFPSDTDELDP